MSGLEDLNEENYYILAAKYYDSPKCVMAEFEEELNRVYSIKKNIGKYLIKNEINERLILNHLIIYANVFSVEFSVRLLFFFMDEKYWSVVKTFLIFLGYMKDEILSIRGKSIRTSDIPVDLYLANLLRKI